MILKKELLTKGTKRGIDSAVTLLTDLSRIYGLPEPFYEFHVQGTVKRPSHFYKVKFRVPQKLLSDQKKDDFDFYDMTLTGAGRDRNKKYAKKLAALEVVHKLESAFGIGRNKVQTLLEEIRNKQRAEQERVETSPVDREISGVDWANLPFDPNFGACEASDRLGRISFSKAVLEDHDAFLGAKAITLGSKEGLPSVDFHGSQTDEGLIKQYANIRPMHHEVAAVCGAKNIITTPSNVALGISRSTAEYLTLKAIGQCLQSATGPKLVTDLVAAAAEDRSSFGMAKIFAQLPQHHLSDLRQLLNECCDDVDDEMDDSLDDDFFGDSEDEGISSLSVDQDAAVDQQLGRRHLSETNQQQARSAAQNWQTDTERILKQRLAAFRKHQKKYPLPIDIIEKDIPFDALVTILRGGTGSGKTTRYPLMLSLLSRPSPSDENNTIKVVVAQPRRLACQTAAQRVALEQGYNNAFEGKGRRPCPIGYMIRFESFPSIGARTVDFATPGVLLRKAMADPLFSDVTHLVLDEIHERNADMDLLVALARTAVKKRANHESLSPLRLVLMSATLDSALWEEYFTKYNEGIEVEQQFDVAIVDVPDAQRYPIDVIHLGDDEFPLKGKVVARLKENRDSDDVICELMASLVNRLFYSGAHEGGSILCFLPGMDEIRQVDRLLRRKKQLSSKTMKVQYLHSSLSSREQANAFVPGPKIILSTNIAETSVTIPDVKIVIDSGRERQHSMLESITESTTVVGSQLLTVNISAASATQRAGRSGRVSAGTCYRLYTRRQLEREFLPHSIPEMLRLELSQLVLSTLALYHATSGHPFQPLLNAPNPPSQTRLDQTVQALGNQGLVSYDEEDIAGTIKVTPLGHAVNSIPASPRIARMLFIGAMLKAVEPALQIAALLSVPRAFNVANSAYDEEESLHCSDIILAMSQYQAYLKDKSVIDKFDPRQRIFRQVSKVQDQLKRVMKDVLSGKPQANPSNNSSKTTREWDNDEWNKHANRVAAQVGVICSATPHIAHLTNGSNDFATRDIAGKARIHPSSINFSNERRVHWYVYHELRQTTQPYLNVTTAVSPLDLALFSEPSRQLGRSQSDKDKNKRQKTNVEMSGIIFEADQWVPVQATGKQQKEALIQLRRLLMHDMLQLLVEDPHVFASNENYQQIILYVLSALEQQRLRK